MPKKRKDFFFRLKIDQQILFLAFVICCSIYLPEISKWFTLSSSPKEQLVLGRDGVEVCRTSSCRSLSVTTKNMAGLTLLGEPLPVNSVNAALLTTIPGIGPKLADRIIRDRQQHGVFHNQEELQRVPGIGPKQAKKFGQFLDFKIK